MIFGNELTRLSADPNILRSYAAPDAPQSAWQILEAVRQPAQYVSSIGRMY